MILTGRFIKYGDDINWPSVGDVVDDSWVNYFIEVLPPAYMGSDLIQIGEPNDHDGPGCAARYSTIQRYGNVWVYTGYQVVAGRVEIDQVCAGCGQSHGEDCPDAPGHTNADRWSEAGYRDERVD